WPIWATWNRARTTSPGGQTWGPCRGWGQHGSGGSRSRQQPCSLPCAHSDFIFAVIGEELGLIGALIVLLVFAVFLWRGLRAALRAPDRFGMLLGIGIVV